MVRRLHYLIVFVMAVLSIQWPCSGQVLTNELILRNLADLDRNPALQATAKLQLLYDWKKRSEALQLPQDSAYARLLHKIGVLEFQVSKNYNAAIIYTLSAFRINSSGKAGA